jgi:hypothetical protein
VPTRRRSLSAGGGGGDGLFLYDLPTDYGHFLPGACAPASAAG